MRYSTDIFTNKPFFSFWTLFWLTFNSIPITLNWPTLIPYLFNFLSVRLGSSKPKLITSHWFYPAYPLTSVNYLLLYKNKLDLSSWLWKRFKGIFKWLGIYRILYLYTERYQTHISNTCPLSTCSSVSANALTWNNKWGRATCTYSRPKIDRKPLTTATISKSQWYALPWVIFFFSWIVIWIFYWWIMVKDVKIFSCPCEQKFSCLNVTCELRAELNVTGEPFCSVWWISSNCFENVRTFLEQLWFMVGFDLKI